MQAAGVNVNNRVPTHPLHGQVGANTGAPQALQLNSFAAMARVVIPAGCIMIGGVMIGVGAARGDGGMFLHGLNLGVTGIALNRIRIFLDLAANLHASLANLLVIANHANPHANPPA